MLTMDSPNDPAFFYHHANVDRLYQSWLENSGQLYAGEDCVSGGAGAMAVRAAEAAVRTAEGTAAYRDAAEHSKTTRKNALVGRQRRGSTTVARSEDNPGAGLFGAAEPDAASATRAAAEQYISATQNQWLKNMRTLGIFEEEANDITRLLRAAQDFMTRKDRPRAQRQKGEAGSAVSNASPSVFCPQQHSPDTPQPHHTQRILPDSCNGHRQPWIA